jgi:DNA polymerase II small subunit
MNSKQIVEKLIHNGILISEEIIKSPEITEENINSMLEKLPESMLFLNKDIFHLLKEDIDDINFKELESIKAIAQKSGDNSIYEKFIECLKTQKDIPACIQEVKNKDLKVIFNYDEEPSKKEVKDFVAYYNARFKAIEGLLKNRQDLSGLTSISRLAQKSFRDTVAIIGIVNKKRETPKGHIMLELEDKTGKINVLLSNNKKDILDMGKNIVLDEIIGIKGSCGDKIIFANSVVLPDVPMHKELKKCPEEIYAMFLSDIHVGSDCFLDKKFDKFLRWLNGEIGGEKNKDILPKIKYLFIIGDLVDGVGIYPNQDEELVIKDIYEQYEECARLLSRIPKHIKIIICPGNHDCSRLSEPQPIFDKKFAKPLFEIPNATLVSNPAIVNIASSEDFPGFDVLMYHGYSFDYFISNVDDIRNNGGYDRADLVMKFLLQRRHLAPTHSSTLYVPDKNKDPLFIEKIPDFFVSGHIHKSYVASYRNISLICGSCWQDITSFQVKVGHNPEPAHVPLVNLQTRQTRVLKF